MTSTKHHPGWNPSMLRQARTAAGLTVEELGEAIRALDVAGFRPPAAAAESIRRHETGRNRPSPVYRKAYQYALHRTADQLGFRPAPADVPAAPPTSATPPQSEQPSPSCLSSDVSGVKLASRPDTGDHDEDPPAGPEEVSPSRRRDLLSAGVAVTVGTVAADATSRAGQISRAIAAAPPDPLTLAQLQHGIQRLTRTYSVTPHAALVAPVEQAWDDAEALLETRVSGADRRDLELVAGQYAYYRGQLAFDMGDDDTALTFLVLAGQHAAAAGDNLLAGSVAVMRAASAFFAGEFATAASIALRAQPGAHPYVAPVLAGSAARALALTGQHDDARAALREMDDTVWTGGPLPGPETGDEEFCEAFSAVVLGYLGEGEQAEPHARASLVLLHGSGRHVQTSGTHLALARAFVRRAAPDPEQAAGCVVDALVAADGNGHGTTTRRAAGIWRQLATNPGWAGLPPVRDLGDRLSAQTRGLPPSLTV